MPGELIEKRYELLEKLGQGGMAQVFRAMDRRVGREVAIKFIARHQSRDPHVIDRFRQEIATLAQLNHEHIVTLFDTGETDDHRHFLVMERLRGETLAKALRTCKAYNEHLSFPRTINIARQICEALEAAHSAQILHRDIKPSNIFLTLDERSGQKDRVKLLDFGIAKVTEGGSAPLTQDGTFVGTAHYVAPELINPIRFGEPDGRADIFSLGVVLFECATGTRPFEGFSPEQVISKTVLEDLPSPCERRPLPTALETIIRTATARTPSERYASIRDLAKALAMFETSLCRQLGTRVGSVRVGSPGAGAIRETGEKNRKKRRRRQPPPIPARPKRPPPPIAGGIAAMDQEPRAFPAIAEQHTQLNLAGDSSADPNPSTVEPINPSLKAAKHEDDPSPEERASTAESTLVETEQRSAESGEKASLWSVAATVFLGCAAILGLYFMPPLTTQPEHVDIRQLTSDERLNLPPSSATTSGGTSTTGQATTTSVSGTSTSSTTEASSSSTGEDAHDATICKRELEDVLKKPSIDQSVKKCIWKNDIFDPWVVDVTLRSRALGLRPKARVSLNSKNAHRNGSRIRQCIKDLFLEERLNGCVLPGVKSTRSYYDKK